MKKLRELMLRIRHWLIRKLGGYTEQRIPPKVRELQPVVLHPQRLLCQATVRYEDLCFAMGDKEKENFILHRTRRELADMMMKEIVEGGWGVLVCDPYGGGSQTARTYRLEVCLVRPEEWMKTSLGDNIAPPPADDGLMDWRI